MSEIDDMKKSKSIKDPEGVNIAVAESEDIASLAVVEKRILRKIDRHLLPVMAISYMLQFLDKTTLGYTSIMGIRDDAHLVGQQYSWLSSAFYCGYLVACYPASYGFVKFPIGKYLSIGIILWAIVLTLHAAPSNFGGLLALRILLGIFESIITPGFSLITAMWYKPSEHAVRHCLWFAGNNFASGFGGILAFAISKITVFQAWRIEFIVFGGLTFLWGFVALKYLPDTPLEAKFLDEAERITVFARCQKGQHSNHDSVYKFSQFEEALLDPKSWIMFLFAFMISMPNGAATNFSSIVISGFGFTTKETYLMSLPSAAIGLIFMALSAILAGRYPRSRCFIIFGSLCISLLGSLLILELPAHLKAGRLIGTFLFTAFTSSVPLVLSLNSSNTAGFTKKATVNALFFIGYCTGNIAGPQTFKASESPVYRTAYTTMLSCMCLAISLIGLYRTLMAYENKRRDREFNVEINPETRVVQELNMEGAEMTEDLTDWEQRATFRYIL